MHNTYHNNPYAREFGIKINVWIWWQMVLPTAVEDVKREVKILRELQGYEIVVQFYNAFEDDSNVYIVMDLCEGGELLDRILAKSLRQTLKVIVQCHLHGLVRCDMKPENFLFKSNRVDSPLKATDFGLSDFIKPGKKFQDIVGSAYYVAPEVLKRKSGPELDYLYFAFLWYLISVKRKKLLLFCKGGSASYIPIDIYVLDNMRQFVRYSRLKQFALRALASTLDEAEISDLKDQFDAIDVDKHGAISLEEMRQALMKDLPWKLKESRVLEILQAIDSNIDGLVDFSEFVAAALHVHQQHSHAAFEKFDMDKDGYITPEELRLPTGLRGSIDPLLEEADIENDRKISLSGFR
ncbi:hypothetical protein UlMin_000313 [Ulmus minor]